MREKLAVIGLGCGAVIGLVVAWTFGVGWLAWWAYGSVAPASWPHISYLPMVGIVFVLGLLMRQAAR